MKTPKVTDITIEHMVAALLRAGVIVSGSVVAAGGIYFLVRHGGEATDYHVFKVQNADVRLVPAIVHGALGGKASSLIQTGILLLIATPIARVAVSLVGFALERDRKYVVITLIVLTVLLYSLISGAAGY
jgi:uncharacterized membrane protein